MTPETLRQEIRAAQWTSPTTGVAGGFVQANLVALPAAHAGAFERFCRANAQACPILEITRAGQVSPALAPGADLRTDLPRYHVYRDGALASEPTNVRAEWRSDFVAFLVGCSFTFEHVLMEAGIRLRHVAEGRNVAMYRTRIDCIPIERFEGKLVVSMRPLARTDVTKAVQICSGMPDAHGAPIAIGRQNDLGIADLGKPDFGDATSVHADDVVVFWACGVTATQAAREARLPLLITHAPGHMLVTDRRIDSRTK